VKDTYKRVDDINEKVKTVSLAYEDWKVLFLVGEKSDNEEISALLNQEPSSVADILASLESKGLIEKAEASESIDQPEKMVDEEPQPSIGDELLEEEEKSVQPSEEPEEEKPELEEKSELEEEIESLAKEDEALSKPPVAEEDVSSVEELAAEEETVDAGIDSPDIQITSQEEDTATEGFDLGLDEKESDIIKELKGEGVAEEAVEETITEELVADKPVGEDTGDEEIITDVSKKTIMVIDDSIVIRKMIEIALEEEDFNIVTAISGKEALEAISRAKPNLVILDMLLPDMNGIDVLKTIKEEKKLPVIMLSGKDSPQLIESAKEIGVDDFLPKPFRDEELVEKVKALIGD
jgi:CheY-like chemotaxis protein